jgi:NADH-quinone oxidoreductase subunit K
VLGIGAYSVGGIDLGTPTGNAAPVLAASNTASIGAVLYRDYLFLFEAAGLILLVAMVGAIVLTHREGRAPRGQQNISKQNGRTWATRDPPAHRPRSSCDATVASSEVEMIGQVSRLRSTLWLGAVEVGMIGVEHYLTVGAILFVLGVLGIFLNRKNIIVILMAVELILLAREHQPRGLQRLPAAISTGQVFAMLVLTVAAAEAAIGLAILVIYFRGSRFDRGR